MAFANSAPVIADSALGGSLFTREGRTPESPLPIAGPADTHRMRRTRNLRVVVFIGSSETEKLCFLPHVQMQSQRF
jgi:hypothetical protein